MAYEWHVMQGEYFEDGNLTEIFQIKKRCYKIY